MMVFASTTVQRMSSIGNPNWRPDRIKTGLSLSIPDLGSPRSVVVNVVTYGNRPMVVCRGIPWVCRCSTAEFVARAAAKNSARVVTPPGPPTQPPDPRDFLEGRYVSNFQPEGGVFDPTDFYNTDDANTIGDVSAPRHVTPLLVDPAGLGGNEGDKVG